MKPIDTRDDSCKQDISKTDELVERLGLDVDVLRGDLHDSHRDDATREAFVTIANNTEDAITAITHLQSQSANPWVKIENLIENVKIGEPVDVSVHDEDGNVLRLPDCELFRREYHDGPYYYMLSPTHGSVHLPKYGIEGHYTPTHYMLPIAPPKKQES